MKWLHDNWLSLAVGLYAALNALNGLLPPKEDAVVSRIATFLNRLVLLRRGTLSLPGVDSAPLAHKEEAQK